MNKFETSDLWKRTLATIPDDPHEEMRSELRNAFLQFRRTVEPLANDIAISMPMFTDHSIAHIDALWDTASLICGSDYPINPAEAFVLGGAFLLHDLGMGLVAFPGGIDSIKKDALFQDTVNAITRSSPDASSADVDNQALTQVLRLRHASQAENLIRHEFESPTGKFYLLQDARLRAAYGALIGKIAHSHWFDVAALSATFGPVLGALPGFPPEWTVDAFKISCILRLADAAQIDSRRAPMYLHAFRRPSGESGNHWKFQERLTLPMLDDDRLKYTSTTAFDADDSEAWWLAYETIRMINNELRQVDAACADLGKRRFAARAVAGAENPLRFAEYVPTEDWTPIDANLRVTDVTRVVEHLGGEALYGDEPLVAVRELISNAADATRARRVQFGGTDLSILVTLKKESSQWVLRVIDRGLGMSATQLVTCLTDFGTSHWTSSERIREYPGLLTKGFKPTGRFGIGFYAAFMVADKVTVKSLKARAASADTHILAFNSGPKGRPILRQASVAEQMDQHGTEVELVLKADPLSRDGILGYASHPSSFSSNMRLALRSMCALLDVDLFFQGPSEISPAKIVGGDEWKSLGPDELYDLLYREHGSQEYFLSQKLTYIDEFRDNLQDILDENGDIIGRAALAVRRGEAQFGGMGLGHVYVGGMRADFIRGILGCFVGEPLTADRGSAFPAATPAQLVVWAESQGQIILNAPQGSKSRFLELYETVAGLGDLASPLPFGATQDGVLDSENIVDWVRGETEIVLLPRTSYLRYERGEGPLYLDMATGQRIDLSSNIVLVDTYIEWLLPDEVMSEPLDEKFLSYFNEDPDDAKEAPYWYFMGMESPHFRILHAAAEAWGCDPYELALRADRHEFDVESGFDGRIELKRADGSVSRVNGIVLKRPAS